MSALPDHPPGWTPERRAQLLLGRRQEFVARLPREVAAARRLRPDVRELVIDDAIEFAAIRHKREIATASDLETVFWSACLTRVARARSGRYDLVRGRFTNAGATPLVHLVSDDDVVVDLEERETEALAHEFAETLDPHEQRVLKAKWDSDGPDPVGYKVIAKRLGMPIGIVRSAERAIGQKGKRFLAIYSAGRLCDRHHVTISSLAQGAADERQVRLAQAHVEHCSHCKPRYLKAMRELASGAFERKVAALLPAIEVKDRHRWRGAWDAVADWASRPFGHDTVATAAQLSASGTGRGVGTIAMLKLAGACLASATAVSVCASSVIVPELTGNPPVKATPTKAVKPKPEGPVGKHDRIETRAQQHLTPTPSPAASAQPKHARSTSRSSRSSKRSGATGGHTGETAHEAAPASPAPANAAAGGASEFDPTYTPSSPPQPAPAPAAQGGGEFF